MEGKEKHFNNKKKKNKAEKENSIGSWERIIHFHRLFIICIADCLFIRPSGLPTSFLLYAERPFRLISALASLLAHTVVSLRIPFFPFYLLCLDGPNKTRLHDSQVPLPCLCTFGSFDSTSVLSVLALPLFAVLSPSVRTTDGEQGQRYRWDHK